ncbi:MAG: aminotransferase class V-fold PLP-dependent enzyme [Candidatus Latescibacteria bacterium]|nr:aminotransferase class V-fold PLP-dependent enzyme [Candidatus Latescibacterota bacterium]
MERNKRGAPLDMSPEEFRRAGHALVDRIADFLRAMPQGAVTAGENPAQVQAALGRAGLPQEGMAAEALLEEATGLLFDHSLFNGHPRFWGYITSSAAPIGALGDMLAATVNANVGGWSLSPMASEIERQTVAWLAELIGYPAGCEGLLVSGGNMANMVGFWAGRRAQAEWDIRGQGVAAGPQLRAYVSQETHTWVQKAADLAGLGTAAVRWIETDDQQRLDIVALERAVAADLAAGDCPFLVVGTAGTVATGSVDPLVDLAALCRQQGLWFHIDGVYGASAAVVPQMGALLAGLELADSIALDPHKWLYAPLEAGCVLVRQKGALVDAFSFQPSYYHLEEGGSEPPVNYFAYGPQNSRGFRALKVWLALRQVGRAGYEKMIGDDIALAQLLYRNVEEEAELEAFSCRLSIAVFRYVPPHLGPAAAGADDYLNELNKELLSRLQAGGQVYLSNAVVDGRFALRACIVNFRTQQSDVEALPAMVVQMGGALHEELRG